ncbi:MAG TPA: ABC transporter permease [Roseomonas sp.]|nr:ABC transporter permease [Roseomonas sp.]
MIRFLARRLLLSLGVAAFVVILSFLMTRLSGDLAISIAGANATDADIAQIRRAYDLDQPLAVQFLHWAGRALTGDLGESFFFKEKVSRLIASRLPITLTLGGVGMAAALLMAIPLGIMAALHEGRSLDRAVLLLTTLGQAMPSFWVALILMIVFGLHLQWLPISGTGSWRHFVMPAFVLGFSAVPALARLTRSGMIRALTSDYVRTARAKGLSWLSIVGKHALRNAAIPIVSIAAVQFGGMLGGSIVIETIFALHGVGFLAWESIGKADFAVIQAVVLLLSLIYVVLTLLTDVLNAVLDPRLRLP